MLLPFLDNLLGLVVLSFLIEVLTLLWGPAKDATVPNIVKDPSSSRRRTRSGSSRRTARSRSAPSFFAVLAGVAKWLGDFHALSGFGVDQESLAIWVDALTFLVSALLISRLRLARRRAAHASSASDVAQTWRDIVDGLQVHPLEPARARRDDRPRRRAHRRRRDHPARARVRDDGARRRQRRRSVC